MLDFMDCSVPLSYTVIDGWMPKSVSGLCLSNPGLGQVLTFPRRLSFHIHIIW